MNGWRIELAKGLGPVQQCRKPKTRRPRDMAVSAARVKYNAILDRIMTITFFLSMKIKKTFNENGLYFPQKWSLISRRKKLYGSPAADVSAGLVRCSAMNAEHYVHYTPLGLAI